MLNLNYHKLVEVLILVSIHFGDTLSLLVTHSHTHRYKQIVVFQAILVSRNKQLSVHSGNILFQTDMNKLA